MRGKGWPPKGEEKTRFWGKSPSKKREEHATLQRCELLRNKVGGRRKGGGPGKAQGKGGKNLLSQKKLVEERRYPKFKEGKRLELRGIKGQGRRGVY